MLRKRSNWYKQSRDEAVIFVPVKCKLNSQYRRGTRTKVKQQRFKIKVVKRTGVAIKRLLQNLLNHYYAKKRLPVVQTKQMEKGHTIEKVQFMRSNVPGVTTSMWEKHQQVHILEGMNTQSHSTERKEEW